MKRIVGASVFAVLIGTVSALGQAQKVNVENGSPRELKGVRKFFVSAAENDDRAKIVEKIRRKLPALILAAQAGADVWLVFTISRRSAVNSPGSEFGGAPSTSEDYEISATGQVVRPIAADHLRKLIEFKDSRRAMFETDLAGRFAEIFIKSYQTANKNE
jgi:hypothetical protein